MKIVVIGGTGLIGSEGRRNPSEKGHEANAAAPNTGVNTIRGEGLDAALAGAQVVVDVANSPSFEDKAAMEFFQTAGKNPTAAKGRRACHHWRCRSSAPIACWRADTSAQQAQEAPDQGFARSLHADSRDPVL